MIKKALLGAGIAALLAGTALSAQAETLRLLTWGGYAPDKVVKMFSRRKRASR